VDQYSSPTDTADEQDDSDNDSWDDLMDDAYGEPKKKKRKVETEISKYLGLERLKLEANVFESWAGNRQFYPRVYQAWRDFTAIQGSSTASERAFSKGGQVVTPTRASMSAETLQAIMGVKGMYQFEKAANEAESA